MDSPLSKRSLKRVTEGSHWRESMVLFPMISALITACSSAHSCFLGTDKEQSPWEMAHEGRKHIGSHKVECPLTANIQELLQKSESQPSWSSLGQGVVAWRNEYVGHSHSCCGNKLLNTMESKISLACDIKVDMIQWQKSFLPVTHWSAPPPQPFLLGELCCLGKGASFLFHNIFRADKGHCS